MTLKNAFLGCVALTVVLSGATVGALSYYLDPGADTLAGATQPPRIARYQKEALAPQPVTQVAAQESAPSQPPRANVLFSNEAPSFREPEALIVTPVVAEEITEPSPTENLEVRRERPRRKSDSWANLR